MTDADRTGMPGDPADAPDAIRPTCGSCRRAPPPAHGDAERLTTPAERALAERRAGAYSAETRELLRREYPRVSAAELELAIKAAARAMSQDRRARSARRRR